MSNTNHNLEIILDNFDLYSILDLSPGESNLSVIKKAYYKKSLEYHPDKNPDDKQKFYIINIAYKILSHAENKKKYDLEYFEHTDKSRNKISDKELSLMNLQYRDYPIIISDNVISKLSNEFTKFSKEMVQQSKTTPKSILKTNPEKNTPDSHQEKIAAVREFMRVNNLQGSVEEWMEKLNVRVAESSVKSQKTHKSEPNLVDAEDDFKKVIGKRRDEEQTKMKKMEQEYEGEKVDERLSRYRNFDNDIKKTLSEQPRLLKSFNLNEFNVMFEKVKEATRDKDDGTLFLDSRKNDSKELIAYNATGSLGNFYTIKNDTYIEPEIESNIPKENINHNMILRNMDYGIIRADTRQLTNARDPIRNTGNVLNSYNNERNSGIAVERDTRALQKIKTGFGDMPSF
jgi:curved DNA-binding protein CbpA